MQNRVLAMTIYCKKERMSVKNTYIYINLLLFVYFNKIFESPIHSIKNIISLHEQMNRE